MCALPALLPCPLCAHPHFDRVEALRDKLIFVSTHTLSCPVCQEEMSGLDKLTIHLFSHVKMRETNSTISRDQSSPQYNKADSKTVPEKPQVSKRPRTQPPKNKPTTCASTPVKFVKIYPKLPLISLNTMPIIEIARNQLGENFNKSLCLSRVTANVNNQVVSRMEPAISDAPFGCDMCGLHFADEQILKMHKSLIHSLSDEASLTLEKFQCHLCNKHFKMKGSLMVHLRVVHYGIPSSSIKNPNSNNHNILETPHTTEAQSSGKPYVPDRNDNKQWFCDVCEKSFTTKYFLKKHKRLHTGETPYACVQCNKTFTFQQSYHKHLLYHNDEKPHSCTFCGRSFKELSTLHNHQRIHTGEKPFSCETCGKCFRQRVSYLVHRRIHTGVMPYKCTACDKSFRYKVSQRTHKCPAQPPGTVVRQSGELLEKLKKKHTECDATSTLPQSDEVEIYSTISEANAELIRTGAKLSFEDTEAENFSLLSKSPNPNDAECDVTMKNSPTFESTASKMRDIPLSYNTSNSADEMNALIEGSRNTEKSIPSPSEILKNLCLTNYDEDYTNPGNVPRTCETKDDLNLDIIYKEFNEFI